MDNTECPIEDHVHCDICHKPILLVGEAIFATDGTEDGVTIYCTEDAKKYAAAHEIMIED